MGRSGFLFTLIKILRHEKTPGRVLGDEMLAKRGRRPIITFINQANADLSMQTYLGMQKVTKDRLKWGEILPMLHD